VLQPSAGQAGPLGESDQAAAAAGDGGGAGGARRARVAYLDRQPVTRRPAYGHRYLGVAGVLAGVGQSLLHDPVGAPPGRCGCGHWLVDLAVEYYAHTSAPRLAEEVGEVDEGGLGPLRCWIGPTDPGAVRAEHADDFAKVLQRLAGTVPDHPGGLGDLLGYGVGTQLQRPGVQG
jgi:hypothetical protein